MLKYRPELYNGNNLGIRIVSFDYHSGNIPKEFSRMCVNTVTDYAIELLNSHTTRKKQLCCVTVCLGHSEYALLYEDEWRGTVTFANTFFHSRIKRDKCVAG